MPPTRAEASAALANRRISGISFPASTLSGALSSVTLRIARLLTIFTCGRGFPGIGTPSSCGVISVTPGAFLSAAVTA